MGPCPTAKNSQDLIALDWEDLQTGRRKNHRWTGLPQGFTDSSGLFGYVLEGPFRFSVISNQRKRCTLLQQEKLPCVFFCSVWVVSLNPSFYFQHCEASIFIFVSLVVLWLRKQYSKICGFGLKAESTWRGVNTKKAFFIQLKRSTEKDTPSQFF